MKFIALAVIAMLTAGGPAAAQPVAAPAGLGELVASPGACAGGLVPDDGSAETGYGWVPSVVEGAYVQEVVARNLSSTIVKTVCVCWLRTRSDTEIDFDVVFYGRESGHPQAVPFASVPAHASGVPAGVTGRFYEVPVGGVELGPGVSYVGVRWDPSTDGFFFVCVDTTPTTPRVEGFFIDDRATRWVSVLAAPDPIFAAHRAMMIRLQALPAEVPALAGPATFLFILVLAVAGAAALKSSPRRFRGLRRR